MIVDTDMVAGIPLVVWSGENANRCPMVIYIHGLGGDKRSGMELGYNLANRGFFFVSIDAQLHGERLDERIAHTWDRPIPGAIYPFESGLDRMLLMFEIVEKTASDISRLIDHFSNDPRVDHDRIGVSGASMGGFVAYRTVAIDTRVKALASLISFPTFARVWKEAILGASTKSEWAAILKKVEDETEKRTQFIQSLDPKQGLIDFAPKPLLMICGDLDTDVPKRYSQEMVDFLRPFYKDHPENLALKVHERGIHRVSSEMIADTTEWFDRHLGNDA